MKTIEKIQEILDSKNIKPSKLMKDLGFSSGLFSQWKSGKQEVSLDKLVSIANYFDCSVDYLLGRTDSPQGINQINTGDVGDNSNVNVNAPKEKTCSDSDETVSELVAVFKNLSFYDKAKVMSLVAELSEKNK